MPAQTTPNPPAFKVAMMGAGYFSQFHRDAWGRINGVDIVGIANRDLDKAKATGHAAFGDLQTMLDATRPDILDIITPPETHFDAIKAALDFGVKAIICQKPFCIDLETGQRAAQMAVDAGVPLIVHENFRFQPWYRAIKAQLDAGAIGDVLQATFRMRTGDGQGPDAYLARQPYFQKMPRLLIHETGVHWVDTFRYLFGDADEVYADLRRLNPVIAGEDAGVVTFGYPSGLRVIYDGNRLLDHATDNPRRTFGEMLVEGTTGTLTLDGTGAVWHRAFGQTELTPVLAGRDWPGFAGDCVYGLQSHVVAALSGHGAFENLAIDYLKIVDIEARIYQSAHDGRKLRI